MFTGFDNGGVAAASFNMMAFNYHWRGCSEHCAGAVQAQVLFGCLYFCPLHNSTGFLNEKPMMRYIHLTNLQFIVFYVTLNIIILLIRKTALRCSVPF